MTYDWYCNYIIIFIITYQSLIASVYVSVTVQLQQKIANN